MLKECQIAQYHASLGCAWEEHVAMLQLMVGYA